jgi:hypothetical protein
MADDSVWTYDPSFALAVVAALIYLVPATLLTWQTAVKYRSWFFLCVLVGAILEVGGYITRAVSTKRVSEIVSTL